MADKAITDLEAASAINGADLFVLQQGDTAKKASGQLLENWLLSMANGHGGIQSIVKTGSTGTNPVVDTYTIEFSDSSTTTFTVTNGKKGAKGDTGAAASVTSSSVQYVESASGTTVPSSGWQNNPPTVAQGNYLWTKLVITFSDGTPVTSYSVARYGVDGSGAVDSVNGQSGVVTLTASDVGALPDTYTPPVTSVNGDTGAVALTAADVGALPASYQAPVTSVNSQTGAVNLTASDLSAIPIAGSDGFLYRSSNTIGQKELMKSLWSDANGWNSGSKTISGLSDYEMFAIRLDTVNALAIGFLSIGSLNTDPTWLRAQSGWVTSAGYGTVYVSFSRSGNELTFQAACTVNHVGTRNDVKVIEIIGVI